jgi:hypothetical protein
MYAPTKVRQNYGIGKEEKPKEEPVYRNLQRKIERQNEEIREL